MIAIELNDGTTPKFLPQFFALSIMHGVDVNSICRELRVEPISSFADQIKFDADEGDDDSTWYSATDGARTFCALAKHALQKFDDLKSLDPEGLKSELSDACELLIKADDANTGFHLIIAIMLPGTEELVGQ